LALCNLPTFILPGSDYYVNLMVVTYWGQQNFDWLVIYHRIHKRPLLLHIFAF